MTWLIAAYVAIAWIVLLAGLDPKLVRYARQRAKDAQRVAYGRALYVWIDRTGRTQVSLAEELGVNVPSVSHWITGDHLPGEVNRAKLRALGFEEPT